MTTNDPAAKESVGEPASIAHSVCHDCEFEETHHARRPEDAKRMGVEAAIEHGRLTEHNVDEELIDEPAQITTVGPDVSDSKVIRR